MPSNPTDGTTTVSDVIVVGSRTYQGFVVNPPAWTEPQPWQPDTPEAPIGEDDEFAECKRRAALNRAALEATSREGHASMERGYLLVRRPDGSVRAIGPLTGTEADGGPSSHLDWHISPGYYGLDSFENVVGIIHNHPVETGLGLGHDGSRRLISSDDVDVQSAFLNAGVDPDFQQFIAVDDTTYAFSQNAAPNSHGTVVRPIVCQSEL